MEEIARWHSSQSSKFTKAHLWADTTKALYKKKEKKKKEKKKKEKKRKERAVRFCSSLNPSQRPNVLRKDRIHGG